MSALARGIIVGVDNRELIVRASNADVLEFAPGQAVHVAESVSPLAAPDITGLVEEGYLYDWRGRKVARLTEIRMDLGRQVEVTTYGDIAPVYMGVGAQAWTITAKGPV